MTDINLTAIRRDDPYAESIVGSATQVAVYKFNSSGNEWEKLDIEGAFFVYSRLAEPRHSFFVMNRLSKKNFGECVIKELEIQCQLPFILFRNDQLHIYGIWFYDPSECKRIFKELETLIQLDTDRRKAEAARNAAKSENQDVLSLLMKAKEQQKKETTKPTTNGTTSDPIKILNSRNDGSLSVAALFGRSHESVESSRERGRLTSVQNQTSSSDTNLLRRLMSVPSNFEPSIPPPTSVVTVEQGLKDVLKIGTSSVGHAKSVPNLAQPLIPGIFPLERTPPASGDDSDEIPLMSPMVFLGGSAKKSQNVPSQPPRETLAAKSLDLLDLLTPQSLVSSSPSELEIHRPTPQDRKQMCSFIPIDVPEVTPLSKQQLAQALAHLLKTDPSFIGTLHKAYLQSLEKTRLEQRDHLH